MSKRLGSLISFFLSEDVKLQNREIVLWILNTLKKNDIRGKTPSRSKVSQKPLWYWDCDVSCYGLCSLEYVRDVGKNTIQIFLNYTFCRFLGMISFVLHIKCVGGQEFFLSPMRKQARRAQGAWPRTASGRQVYPALADQGPEDKQRPMSHMFQVRSYESS